MKRFLGRRCAPNIEPIKDYFWVSRDTNGSIGLGGRSGNMTSLFYSFDGHNWTAFTNIRSSSTRYIDIRANQKLYIKGVGTATCTNDLSERLSFMNITMAGGNIMSFLYGDDFEDKTSVGDYAFAGLFFACTTLKNVSSLKLSAISVGRFTYYATFYNTRITKCPELPATTLGESCYRAMFQYCTALTEMSELPATALATHCCFQMFMGCTSLKDLRVLPATTLAEECYREMFRGCSGITHIPHNLLPATNLAKRCYYLMFLFCSGIEVLPQDLLPASVMAEGCYDAMFYGCTNLNYLPSKLLAKVTTLAKACFGHNDVSSIPDWGGMFGGCTKLSYIPQGFLPCTNLAENCYCFMFKDCTGLTGQNAIPSNLLPATTLVRGCYCAMFYNCTGLTSVPTNLLPATTLAPFCYYNMFARCGGLTTVPKGLLDSAATMESYACARMFYNCTGLTTIPDNFLPATTLAGSCYASMFAYCTSLTNIGTPIIPENAVSANLTCFEMFKGCSNLQHISLNLLPTSNLATACYKSMFEDCEKLENMCTLSATTLAEQCYYSMFKNCDSLTTVQPLPATTLANSCYREMFYDCDELTVTPAFAPQTTADYCCYQMFMNCDELTDISNIDLSQANIASYAYNSMFNTCKKLKNLPNNGDYVIGTTAYVGQYGCNSMFRACETLEDIPILPSLGSIQSNGYAYMFMDCKALTTTGDRVLPANYIYNSGYEGMFQGCDNLATVRADFIKATKIFISGCKQMFKGCKSLTVAPYILPNEATSTEPYQEYAFAHMFEDCYTEVSVETTDPVTGETTTEVTYTGLTSMAIMPNESKAKLVFTGGSGRVDASMFSSMFKNCKALTSIPYIETGYFMNNGTRGACPSMFEGCSSITIVPQNWLTIDTTISAPQNGRMGAGCFKATFKNCTSLTTVVSPLPSVFTGGPSECFMSMFENCISLANIPADFIPTVAYGGLSTKSSCEAMFKGCKSLEIAPYIPDCTMLTNYSGEYNIFREMFANCYDDITGTGLIRMARKPGESRASITIDGASGNSCQDMFSNCKALEEVPKITLTNPNGHYIMYKMFYGCDSVVSTPVNFITTNALPDNLCNSMFKDCKGLQEIKSGFLTVTGVESLNASASLFNEAFSGCSSLTTVDKNMLPFNTLCNSCYYKMFYKCEALTQAPNLPTTIIRPDTNRRVGISCYTSMFEDCTSLVEAPDIGFNSDSIDEMSVFPGASMFKGCTALKNNLPLLRGKIYGVEMFNDCTSIESIELYIDNTSAAANNYPTENVNQMFYGCTNLQTVSGTLSLNLKYANAGSMFYNCTELVSGPTITITNTYNSSSTSAPYVYNCSHMFYNCRKLVSLNGTITADNPTQYAYYQMFYDCVALKQAPAMTLSGTIGSDTCCRMFYNCSKLGSPLDEEQENAPDIPFYMTITNGTLGAQAFYGIFSKCSNLKTINGSITITAFGSNFALANMFDECSKLENLPTFIVNTESIGPNTYLYMFRKCEALKEIPTSLFTGVKTISYTCCKGMFIDCTSLTEASTPPVKNAADYCYQEMFNGCTNLTKITCMLESRATADTFNWVSGVAANGTFYKKRGVAWPIGSSGIPSGWTVIEVD